MPKLVLISDTHNHKVRIPECDIVLHAGDATNRGYRYELQSFLDWYGEVPATHKVYVAGNHDFICEGDPDWVREKCSEAGVNYLECQLITLEGLRIYGTPWSPRFHDWAFNADAGLLEKLATEIPECDVLISHGPPYGILDRVDHPRVNEDPHVGDKFLLKRILEIRPKLVHVGHIHEARGTHSYEGVRFFNTAICDLRHSNTRDPFVVEL